MGRKLKGIAPPGEKAEPEAIREKIRRFLREARSPAVIEDGKAPLAVEESRLELHCLGAQLRLEAWDDTRHLHRRVTGMEGERTGELVLAIERFGGKKGRLSLIDLAAPRGAVVEKKGRRGVLRQLFGRMLAREFPGAAILELSSEAALEHSLSPAYPRGLVRLQGTRCAALCGPPGGGSGALGAGLIWLDYLRRRDGDACLGKLLLFLPCGETGDTMLRLPYLDSAAVDVDVYAYAPDGGAARLEPSDSGNVDTRLEVWRSEGALMEPELRSMVERLAEEEEVEVQPLVGGAVSLRIHGEDFAQFDAGGLWVGLEGKRERRCNTLEDLCRTARFLHAARSWNARDPQHPLYRRNPEAWLESQVRRSITTLDASLRMEPIYGQVPAMAREERGVMDLLAVTRQGRLAVIEVKATADMQLPMQALDYWVRVKWHLERGEFSRYGYFPGVELTREAPLLLLVAPSLEFHSTTGTLLRFLSPEVEVFCVGVGLEWRKELRVMFRLGRNQEVSFVAPPPAAGYNFAG